MKDRFFGGYFECTTTSERTMKRLILFAVLTAVAFAEVCVDKNPRYCWFKSHCQTRGYMKTYCKKFCGLCDDTGTGGTGTGGTGNVKDDCLKAHNEYRRKHRDTPDLVWDADLARGAEQYAKTLLDKSLTHSKGNYGENLYKSFGSGGSAGACKTASDSWYSEIKKYDFNSPGYKRGVGHFTQMVWKSSTKLGVGIASSGGTVVVVARYTPQGNWMRKFGENVMRLK